MAGQNTERFLNGSLISSADSAHREIIGSRWAAKASDAFDSNQ
jgi:hypothetical protein